MHSNRHDAGAAQAPRSASDTLAPGSGNNGSRHPLRWPGRLGLGLAVTLALAGCAVGPDFSAPKLPAQANAYSDTALPTTTAAAPAAGPTGAAQRLVYGQDLPAQWWDLFHSEPLNQLIRRALEQNPTLASAQASLREARENFNATAGTLDYPSVSGQLGATRERSTSLSATPSVFNLYNASVNVSYTLDVFGGSRRQLEGMKAAVDYQRYEVEATYQSLVSNVVTTAIQEASLRAQIDATQAVLAAQQRQLDVVRKQLALGAVSSSAVLSQATLVAQTRAQLPPLEKSLAQARHQLAVYVGAFPGEGGLPEFRLDSLQLPPELPVSLPSELARQRPDIQASEALLHQASAQVGVATANLYPQISLSGSYSLNRVDMSVGGASSTLWSLGAGITQPLFNGGSLRAKRRAADAAYDQAAAAYRETVLKAFQNVADALRAVDADATALNAQADAVGQAKKSLDISTRQYALGSISYVSLLDSERSYQQAQVAFATARAARLADSAALFVALGGGWWNRTEQGAAAVAPPARF
ncbi:efflux transporter outer membrane subunit [Paludibacterium yongneupense]|uniref:efflux transporter outer membrane subunit n=1 Tax=Paludibacterium yongneupense TaxID=400061 RepID=UPI001FE4DD0D|nr:efflux transporter outer membrane subunit [Paludibacterium yongneupense]